MLNRFFILALAVLVAWSNSAYAADGLRFRALTHDGLDRGYYIYVPRSVARQTLPVPVVMMLHGGGGSGQNADAMTGFSAKAAKEGFIAVFPNGTGRRDNALLTWNADHCCSFAMKNNIDDVGFLSKVIDDVVRTQNADKSRIYVTGLSNGGMMAHKLGRELSHKVAAIAPVISGLFGDEGRARYPVPMMSVNGALDQSIPVGGGQGGGRAAFFAWDGTPLKPISYQGAYWAQMNGCINKTSQSKSGKVIRTTYECPRSAPVVQYVVMDNGHAWPGGQKGTANGDEPSLSFATTDEIWNFFKSHRR